MNIEHFDFLLFFKLLVGYLLGFCSSVKLYCESIKVAGVLNPKWQGSSVSKVLQYGMIYDYLLDGMLFEVLFFVC